eukprot:5507170-Alexandrium_andersonii.AAC.1
MERARTVLAVALLRPSANGGGTAARGAFGGQPTYANRLRCGGRHALTLASLAYAESMLLRCMHSLHRGWGSG